MSFLWLEFFHFSGSMLAILVSISAAFLFLITFRRERKLNGAWRVVGFSFFTIAFFVYILERKFTGIGIIGVIAEFIAYIAIFLGILADPILSHLQYGDKDYKEIQSRQTPKFESDRSSQAVSATWKETQQAFKAKRKRANFFRRLLAFFIAILLFPFRIIKNFFKSAKTKGKRAKKSIQAKVKKISPKVIANATHFIDMLIGFVILFIVFLILADSFPTKASEFIKLIKDFLASGLLAISLIFIILTLKIQIFRLFEERKYKKSRLNNLYPMLAYIFLFIRVVALILYRLPDLNLVYLRLPTIEFGSSWQIAIYCTFFAFAFLAMWAWRFIKVRVFLRIYVVLLTVAILVSTLGAMLFSVSIFQVVETNNLQLMERGAKTQNLIMTDRKNTASFVARVIDNDNSFSDIIAQNDYQSIFDQMGQYLINSGVDILRVFNEYGEIVSSPSDIRDVGRIFSNDKYLMTAISEKRHIKTLDQAPGVLSSVIVARALHPILDGDNVIGVIEVGYEFDNAFVDFSKETTGLDTTIYNSNKISATTEKTIDGASRWIGSIEIDSDVGVATLQRGKAYSSLTERLGVSYYSSFKALRAAQGEIIGMVAVGTPTRILFEDTRQSLLSVFNYLSILSFLIAFAGYFSLRSVAIQSLQSLLGERVSAKKKKESKQEN